MCGFVGFTGAIADKHKVIERMSYAIRHRGPDGEGYFIDEGVAFGHRRLAIIDIEGGRQPMVSKGKGLVVSFNGEIYNFLTLRAELEAMGHTFQTDHSDTEVLIHGYEAWGEDMVRRLRGMFSFAIWNTKTQTLFCARDHFGIKPFYYYQTKKGDLLFGSEIKSFLHHPDFEKSLNEEQLARYLSFQYSPGEDTFFTGVKKLLPAHALTFSGGKVSVKRYWQAEFQENGAVENPVDTIEQAMKESVQAHKISDVEIGSFLSSGIDSSYIAKLSQVDKTFTIGYEESKYDESPYAQAFSKKENFENHTTYINAQDYWDAVEQVQYHMDEPLADASAVSLYFLNREAAKHVKVCFSGEGADEIFGGYNVYSDAIKWQKFDKIPSFIKKPALAVAKHVPQVKGVNFLVRNLTDLQDRYLGCSSLHQDPRRLLKTVKGSGKPTDLTKPYFNKAKHKVNQMQAVDIHMWLAGDILLKADKMSMASSLELRVPFLDKEVFAVASRLPIADKCTTDKTKIALRSAAERSINLETANKKKLGFPVPVRDWLRQEEFASKVRTVFANDVAQRYFKVDEIQQLLADHMAHKQDNWHEIWAVYAFLLWYDAYFVHFEKMSSDCA